VEQLPRKKAPAAPQGRKIVAGQFLVAFLKKAPKRGKTRRVRKKEGHFGNRPWFGSVPVGLMTEKGRLRLKDKWGRPTRACKGAKKGSRASIARERIVRRRPAFFRRFLREKGDRPQNVERVERWTRARKRRRRGAEGIAWLSVIGRLSTRKRPAPRELPVSSGSGLTTAPARAEERTRLAWVRGTRCLRKGRA